MDSYGLAFHERFKAFKEQTLEEYVIASLTKGVLSITSRTSLLDIGGGSGKVAQLIQPATQNITIVDVMDYGHGLQLIQERWEDAIVTTHYDVVLMSHVYGKFARAGTLQLAFEKALQAVAPGGSLVVCYNQNVGVTAQILSELKDIDSTGLIDYFDESLLPTERREYPFIVQLKERTYSELVNYLHVLYEMPDEAFAHIKEQALQVLKKHLEQPVLEIPQKVVVVPKPYV